MGRTNASLDQTHVLVAASTSFGSDRGSGNRDEVRMPGGTEVEETFRALFVGFPTTPRPQS